MKALIIDDEPFPARDLQELIKKHCFELTSVDITFSPIEGIKMLGENHFDILFLDVEMPGISGIELLKRVQPLPGTQVIFTTAYSEYALDAFQADAIHYIVKPVDEDELIRAVKKAQRQLTKSSIDSETQIKTISIFDSDEYLIVPQVEIIRIEGDGGYSKIILDNQEYLSTKRIGYYEQIMSKGTFMRVHKSHIVNLTKVKKISKGDTTYLTIINGDTVPVSSSKSTLLKNRLGV